MPTTTGRAMQKQTTIQKKVIRFIVLALVPLGATETKTHTANNNTCNNGLSITTLIPGLKPTKGFNPHHSAARCKPEQSMTMLNPKWDRVIYDQ